MLEVRKAHISGRHADLLPPTSLQVSRGSLILVRGETQDERTALALALTARMKPVNGVISWDDQQSPKLRRKISALVDAPEINEPEHHLKVTDLVTEDLALVPRRYRGALLAKPWLKLNRLEDIEGMWVDAVSAQRRTDLLTQLALADPAVDLMVIDSPDRHSADVSTWLPRLQALANDAGRPLAVVATVAALPEEWTGPSAVIGNSAEVLENHEAEHHKHRAVAPASYAALDETSTQRLAAVEAGREETAAASDTTEPHGTEPHQTGASESEPPAHQHHVPEHLAETPAEDSVQDESGHAPESEDSIEVPDLEPHQHRPAHVAEPASPEEESK